MESTLPLALPECVAQIREVFGEVEQVSQEEWQQMNWQDEADPVELVEPILAKKDCKLRIDFVEPIQWTVKAHVPGHAGEVYPALKVTHTIIDQDVQTEHEGSRIKAVFETQFNLQRYPYLDKKSGSVKWLGRASLYELEEAFGFDPVYLDAEGQPVEPFISRTGRKLAPKGEGITRRLNLAFTGAYFESPEQPKRDAWINKEVYADVEVEESEQYGNKNSIKRYKPAPVQV